MIKYFIISFLISASTILAECVNDDSVSDRDGDTCSNYYDLDNSVCGIYDTETFTSTQACCSCQMASFEISASQFTNSGGKCRGTLLETSEAQFEGTRKLMLWRQKQDEDKCYQDCLNWDESSKYSYENSDSMCCEYKMINNGTAQCSLYFQGDNSKVLTQSIMDLGELGIEMSAQVFVHFQVPIKDMGVDDVLEEIDTWWMKVLLSSWNVASLVGIPMIFFNDNGLSTNQVDNGMNLGLISYIVAFSWMPYTILVAILYFQMFPTENQLAAYNLIYDGLLEDASSSSQSDSVDGETLSYWSKLSSPGDKDIWIFALQAFSIIIAQGMWIYIQIIWIREASTYDEDGDSILSVDSDLASENAMNLLFAYCVMAIFDSYYVYQMRSKQKVLNQQVMEFWPEE